MRLARAEPRDTVAAAPRAGSSRDGESGFIEALIIE
jgi:hypothetical protein